MSSEMGPVEPASGRYVFAGGGTGGHIYMAVAVREELLRRDPACQSLFVGTAEGMESRILPPLGFQLQTIRVGGLNRVGSGRMIRTLMQLPGSLIQSRRILRDFRPTLTVCLGGYSAGPVVVAARSIGCPAVLIEPNAVAGLTNRLVGPLVRAAAVAFEQARASFPGKATLTGIPIRAAFHEIPDWTGEDAVTRILIFGGSRGSRPINRLMCEALSHLIGLNLRLVHQTGSDDFAWVKEAYTDSRVPGRVTRYIDDMPGEFARTDLILARSGASSVAEINAAGRASILIPFPAAADNHQEKNARALERVGAAVVVKQEGLSGALLAQQIRELVEDRSRIGRMATASRRLSHPESAVRMVDLLQEVQRSG